MTNVGHSTTRLSDPLTEQELEILASLVENRTDEDIANHLHLSRRTLVWHTAQIFEKLGVENHKEALKQAQLIGLLGEQPQSLLDTPHNLPQQSTVFIGRNQELSELNNLLNNPSVRMVTILASGGMGKTRLALQLAQEQLTNFPDGVFFVDLSPLTKCESIISTLIEILQLIGYDDTIEPKQAILNYLQNQQLLLVFDNFEHLLEGATLISDILHTAPQVKILVTSRERLNIKGENTFILDGMAVPLLNSVNQIEYDAVRLFLDSAQRLRSDYEMTEDDLPAVLEICQLVEGMPLAIELASAWIDVLSPENIATELRQSIDILETDMRDVPERHRSIRATFNHSWERLSETEQNVMMRLSVFRSGFTHEAAIRVAEANLRTVRRLVNKALLHVQPNGRYTIHELLRQFCEIQLVKAGHDEETLNQHAAYFAEFLENSKVLFGALDPSIHQAIGS